MARGISALGVTLLAMTRATIRRPLRVPPTARELEILLAYLEHGSYELAAHALGISETRVADALSTIRSKTGATNTAQAVYRLGIAPIRRRQGAENRA